MISWRLYPGRSSLFYVSVVVKNRRNDLITRITTVWGSTYEEKKQEFIYELHDPFLNWDGPALIGGDFNLVRFTKDKNNDNVDFR
jgi:endonuclease/exonuclease/phosphatase (EEP) superfamily protein YafD